MTAYRFWTLTCDECGAISDAGQSRTVYEALTAARQDGWRRVGRSTDICNLHPDSATPPASL